jgi:hypothetical protein
MGIGAGTMGLFLGLLVVLESAYVLVFFREANPFSELPYAGETILKGFFWAVMKVLMAIYALIDLRGHIEFPATLVFTVIFVLFLIHGHLSVGLYKVSNNKV